MFLLCRNCVIIVPQLCFYYTSCALSAHALRTCALAAHSCCAWLFYLFSIHICLQPFTFRLCCLYSFSIGVWVYLHLCRVWDCWCSVGGVSGVDCVLGCGRLDSTYLSIIVRCFHGVVLVVFCASVLSTVGMLMAEFESRRYRA